MSTEIIACWNCQQKVRVDKNRIEMFGNAQCGNCKMPLVTEIIVCWNCQQKVRIDKDKIEMYRNAQCGNCKMPLFATKEEEQKVTDFDYRSLNNSARQSQPQEDPRDVEAYLKQELQKGVNGNPQRLKANYEKLQNDIDVKKVKLEIVARQHDGAKRAELEGQAQAKIGRLNQILNDLYFQEAASFDVYIAPLPPEPVFRPQTKPMGWFGIIFKGLFVAGGLVVTGFFIFMTTINGNKENKEVTIVMLWAGLIICLVGIIGFFPYMSRLANKSNEQEEELKREKEAFGRQHAEWEKLKREHELLKNKTRGQDELDKYL